jgi:hypothetical protein
MPKCHVFLPVDAGLVQLAAALRPFVVGDAPIRLLTTPKHGAGDENSASFAADFGYGVDRIDAHWNLDGHRPLELLDDDGPHPGVRLVAPPSKRFTQICMALAGTFGGAVVTEARGRRGQLDRSAAGDPPKLSRLETALAAIEDGLSKRDAAAVLAFINRPEAVDLAFDAFTARPTVSGPPDIAKWDTLPKDVAIIALDIERCLADATPGEYAPISAAGRLPPADWFDNAVATSGGQEVARTWTTGDAEYLAAVQPSKISRLLDSHAFLRKACSRLMHALVSAQRAVSDGNHAR